MKVSISQKSHYDNLALDFRNATLGFRNEMSAMGEDRDPSHATPEYQQWRKGEIKAKHTPRVRGAFVPARDYADFLCRQTKKEYDERVQEDDRSFKSDDVLLRTREFAAQIASGGVSRADKLIAEVRTSGDRLKARALRNALLEVNGKFAEGEREDRLWANRVRGEVARWQEDDETKDVKEARDSYNAWAAENERLLQEAKHVGDEITPPGFMKDGGLDDLIGLPSAEGSVVFHPKDGALTFTE